MNSEWLDFLGAQGARIDNGKISDFGDLETELAAAGGTTLIAPLSHLGLIECAGEDAKTFLQNQLTSDVNHLEEDSAQYSSWCSPKGRMLASFILYRRGTDYLALLSADLQEWHDTSCSFESIQICQKDFSSPDRTVCSIAGSVKRYADHLIRTVILCHAGKNVCIMVLYLHYR